MVDLYCTPFVDLIDRMRLEYRTRSSLFDLPQKKWFAPREDWPDLSVTFHGRRAGNPVGPAAGPQTQMAQNLVLGWLAGARIFELKTVQVNDRLKIPRPCIDAANVGYNVEWSQELRLPESLDQYVQGAMLIHMLRHSPESLGLPGDLPGWHGPQADTLFDMSVGYDLKGIQSDPVRRFIDGMLDASQEVERLRDQIPARLKTLRELDYPYNLSQSITLSTFHGCPADEIESICSYLLTEVGVDVIVKMNPPMLGKDRLEYLLYDVIGYHEVKVNPEAYTSGLQFDESILICRRLASLARQHGRSFGAKFSNTLEVLNHKDFFTPDNKVMYLSGPPLHVITLALAHKFRQEVGHEMPITFSAGVDRKNFPLMVACGFKPVTTCTDLLKPGGYGRLPGYLGDLAASMVKAGATTVDEYLLQAFNHEEQAKGDPVLAGFLNTQDVMWQVQNDERYYQKNNRLVPKRINSHLTVFDCITCNKCIPVCPNDANFLYRTPKVELTYRDLLVKTDGSVSETGEPKRFNVERTEQIANFADYCNHCGNCDTFCPEYDGPYLMKPSFFGSRRSFEEGAPHDGFLFEVSDRSGGPALHGRIQRQTFCLDRAGADQETWHFDDGTVRIELSPRSLGSARLLSAPPKKDHIVNLCHFLTMHTLWGAMTDPTRVHQVNAPLLAERSS